MPRRALFRGADRRRRHHGERLSRAGDRSPTATRRGLFGDISARRVPSTRYKKAVDEGLLKIMSKMGISVISSYRGGYNFEAVGLSRALVAEYLPRHASRASPASACAGIAAQGRWSSTRAPATSDVVALPIGGFYKLRGAAARRHAFEAQPDPHAAGRGRHRQSYADLSSSYSEAVRQLPPIALRDLLDFRTEAARRSRSTRSRAITEIRKRFVTPGMSLGALSPEAHETLNDRHEPHRRQVRLAARAARIRRATSRAPTATTPTRRSSRSPRAASASPRNI